MRRPRPLLFILSPLRKPASGTNLVRSTWQVALAIHRSEDHRHLTPDRIPNLISEADIELLPLSLRGTGTDAQAPFIPNKSIPRRTPSRIPIAQHHVHSHPHIACHREGGESLDCVVHVFDPERTKGRYLP